MAKYNWTFREVESLYRDVFPDCVDGGGRVVLLADADGSGRNTAVSALKRRGFIVEAAVDGLEALRFLETQEFDCCILDMQLPQVEGLELLQAIRSDDRCRDLPVVFTYGGREEEEARVAGILGACAVVSKPVDPNGFARMLVEAVPVRRTGG